MTFGVTPQGLVIKRLADIRDEMNDDARGVYGVAVDLDVRRPLGQFITIQAERLAEVWELLEQLYNSFSPRNAEGKQFDEVAAYNGLQRRPATFSKVGVTLIGDAGTIVPLGSRASVNGSPEAIFATDAAYTIGAGVDEVQTILFGTGSGGQGQGDWTLVYGGQATTALAYNANNAAIKAALEALSNITEVTITGQYNGGIVVTFTGADGDSPKTDLTIGTNTLASKAFYRFTPVADVAGSLNLKYFTFGDTSGTVAVWIDLNNAGGTIPAGALAANRAIEVSTINTNDSAATVLTKLVAAITADAALTAFDISSNLWISVDAYGAASGVNAGNSGFTAFQQNPGYATGTMPINIQQTTPGALPSVSGFATAEDAGPIPAPAGSLTVLEDTVTGWTAITNALDAEQGLAEESDADFKIRRVQQIASPGRCTPNAIRARMLAVPDVVSATVYVNNEDFTVGDLPPHSVRIVLLGGLPVPIATQIFDSVAGGIRTYGLQTQAITDDSGFLQTLRWDNADEIAIWIILDLVVNDDFPQDGEQQIIDSILAFGAALGTGDDVIVYPYLMCTLDVVVGIIDAQIKIGTAAAPTLDNNISIAPDELAKFDSSRITINIT